AKLGFPAPFDPQQEMGVIDDHSPFVDAGVPDALVLLDFQYGARTSPGPNWHTAGDTLAAVSADSLARVGRPLLALLRDLAARGAPGSADPGGPAPRWPRSPPRSDVPRVRRPRSRRRPDPWQRRSRARRRRTPWPLRAARAATSTGRRGSSN